MRPDHGGVSVPDLDASIVWYRDMLDFTVDVVMDIPADTGRLAMLKNGDFRMELFEVPGAAPLPDDRRDVETLIGELRARGVDIVWDVQEHGGMKAAFIRDNSGNLVELMENPTAWDTPRVS